MNISKTFITHKTNVTIRDDQVEIIVFKDDRCEIVKHKFNMPKEAMIDILNFIERN